MDLVRGAEEVIRWPWVSRRAYDLALRQLADKDMQIAQLLRMHRGAAGLPEVPVERKEKPTAEPIPTEIRQVIDGFESDEFRAALYQEVRAAREQNVPWEQIYDRIDGGYEWTP